MEAKEVGRKLAGFDEQLADYFAKDPNVKLGILTNGAQWRFFTDVENPNVMDREPFARWDLFSDNPPPFDVITLIQKTQYNAELIRAYAHRQRAQNLLVSELTRLLEPHTDFARLAVANIETRNLTEKVIDSWKPVVASALNEWARQRMLSAALATPQASESKAETVKIETTQEELDAFVVVKKLLGEEFPVEYEDTTAYFKIHLPAKRMWVVTRLQFRQQSLVVWVPMPQERAAEWANGRPLTTQGNWSVVTLDKADQLPELDSLFREAYSHVKRQRGTAE